MNLTRLANQQGNQAVNRTVTARSRRVGGRAAVVLCAGALAFSACTDTVDPEYMLPGSTAEDDASAGEIDGDGVELDGSDTDPDHADADGSKSDDSDGDAGGDSDGDAAGAGNDGDDVDDTAGPVPDEPDLAMVAEGQIPEAGAEEPPAQEPPEISDEGPVDVPQATLGAGESVLCATIQISIDAVDDGDDAKVAKQRVRLLDGVDSLDDGRLADLVAGATASPSLNGDRLGEALDRCGDLGYEA